MDFFKNFWIRIVIIIIFLTLAAFGGWYWFVNIYQKPAVNFYPSKIAFSQDENIAYIAAFQKLGIYDASLGKLSLQNASFSNDVEIISGSGGKIYVADLNLNKVFAYGDNKQQAAIDVGAMPRFLFLNDKTGRLFVYNRGSRDINVIDTGDYKILSTIKIDLDINGGVLDEKSNLLYLADANSNDLIMIDGATFKVSKSLKVGQNPYASFPAAFDENDRKLYLISKGDNKLWVIDTDAGKVLDNIDAPKETGEMTLSKQKLYIASPNEHAVFIFDAKNLSTKKISLSPLLYPQKALADEKNGRIYVYSMSRVNEITVLDMDGKVVKNIPVGYPLSDFKISEKTSTVYALSRAGGFMLTIKDGKEKFIYKKPEIVETKLNWPNLLRIGPSSRRLYTLSDFSNNYLSYDSQSLNLIDELSLGGGPYIFIGVGESPAIGKGYIINKGINELWLIESSDKGALSVNKKIKVNKNISSGIGLNNSSKLYVASDDSIVVIDAKKDEIIKTIDIKGKLTIVGADQERDKIFVNIDNKSLIVIDGNSDAVENSLTIDIGKAWFDNVNSRIYVLGSDKKSLSAINSANLKTVGQTSLDDSYNEMAAAPWVKKIYFLNSGKNKLTVLNGSLKKITTIDVNGSLEGASAPQATTIYPDEKTNKIFLAHRYGQITVIDAVANTIVSTIKLPYAANPVSLRTDPENNRLYVANKWLNQIQVYNLKDYTLMAGIDAQGNTHWLVPQE
jgi:DNA-binding beta-propeller fold protein YncE